MNRRERRKASKLQRGSVVNVSVGRIAAEPGLKLKCYACGNDATEWPWPNGPAPTGYGVAEVNGERFALCEPCCYNSDTPNVIARRFMNAPNVEIRDMGKVDSDVFDAIIERGDTTEH
jgi:hypothetical protein